MKKKEDHSLIWTASFFMNRQFKTWLFMVIISKGENSTYLKLLSKKRLYYFNLPLKLCTEIHRKIENDSHIGLVWKASNLPKASKHKKKRKESLAEKKPFPTH